ncbi:hypothetical protein ACFL1H_01415 [Nanoarchaeota archaeon]
MEQKINLESITEDLIEIFENEIVRDKHVRVDEYCQQKFDSESYKEISDLVKHEILPMYKKYENQKSLILQKQKKRTLPPYIIGTIAGLEVFELVLTRGISLTPIFLFPSLIVEGGLGYVFYKIAHYSDTNKIINEKNILLEAVRIKDKMYLNTKRFESIKELKEGELSQADAYSLLNKYKKPEHFWAHYDKVIAMDPSNENAIDLIDIGPFEDFLEKHVNGEYSKEVREKRLNDLYIYAHKYFIEADKEGYVLKEMKKSRHR